jgi:hypothetical protein
LQVKFALKDDKPIHFVRSE